ncbi:MAG: 16S rRNA (cytidine(1402)-2'-O)-methyltransferase [Planctomycetaceae bacterium]
MSGTLFVVGTPIGNLGDLTDRARETLAAVDLIAAEDTRRTGRLLQAIGGVRARLVSFHDANERGRVAEILRALAEGHDAALVSDGGMPLVSDPGYRLVREAGAAGVAVRVVPGPSAAIAGLVVSGLPTDRWAFEGFLPKKAGERARRLAALADDPRTLVLFESPLRTRELLAELGETFGADRRVALCRELTKLHEEVLRGTLDEVADALGDEDPRGEVVVVVEGSRGAPVADPDALLAEARALVEAGLRPREAAKAVASRHGTSANQLYRSLTGS